MDAHTQHLLAVAGALQVRWLKRRRPALAVAAETLTQLCRDLEALKVGSRKLAMCQQHGWHLAGQRLLADLRYSVQELAGQAPRSAQALRVQPESAPSLRQLYDELVQAEQEFGDVD